MGVWNRWKILGVIIKEFGGLGVWNSWKILGVYGLVVWELGIVGTF